MGFALRQNGVLFLGKAEMLLNHAVCLPTPSTSSAGSSGGSATDVAEGAPDWASLGTCRSTRVRLRQLPARLRNELLLTNPVAQIAVGAGRAASPW